MQLTKFWKINNKGQTLVLTLLILSLITLTTIVVTSGSLTYFKSAKYSVESVQALNLAEAGIDKAVASLNSTAGVYNGETETVLGPGTFSVVITSVSDTAKVIESTGYVPNKANVKSKRTIKIQISKGIGASFNYGIQNGAGGLVMANNSRVNGSVYGNGDIIMQNNARITGDAYVAGGIQPNPDQESDCSDPNCTDYIFGRDNNGVLDVAQSFQPSKNGLLNKVALKLKKYGSPPDLTVRIIADNSGKPDKNSVLASGTLGASLATYSYGFVDVVFPTPPNLVMNTTYWIVTDTTANSSNYWGWSNDSLQGYTRGSPMWHKDWQGKSTDWAAINGDLGFQTYMDGVATFIQGTSGSTIEGNAHANTLKDITVLKGAYYQAASGITAASYHPGSPDPVAQPMPLSDGNIQAWKDLAVSAGTYTGDISTCPASLPAGKYIGSMTFPNSCTIRVGSPIWVTGDLTLNNNITIQLDPALGGSSGVFIVDNFITLGNGNSVIGNGLPGSYLILLSEFNSRDDPSHRNAINVTNNGNTVILYSNYGSVSVANNNTLKAVTAWKLILNENVIINYDQGLAGTFFSSGPSGAFSVIRGTYQAK